MRIGTWRAAIVATILTGACDDSFSPIQPSDLQFSVFGYLDASAETQWIRVMPIRPVLQTAPGLLGARVTLEHLGTGRIIELRDSAFRFFPNPEVGSEGVYLHNFWTTERIEPGARYRFSAQPDGKRVSEAVVDIPPDYETEVWLGQNRLDLVHVVGLRHLAFVKRTTAFYDDCGAAIEEVLASNFPEDDVKSISISRGPKSRQDCGTPVVEKAELLVVGSGAKWPSGQDHATLNLDVPDAPSNISNSLGFIGGVITKRLPYEICQIEDPPLTVTHCRLRYDAESATLMGTVSDALCTGAGVARAVVRLRELDPERPGSPMVRSAISTRAGTYEIGALEPNRRYALSVGRLIPAPEYREHTDTLQFTPGERARYDVELHPVEPCPTES